MSNINFIKADGTKTTLDVNVTDFKANVKFTTDDLATSEYIQLDEYTKQDGSSVMMIVLTLFARLSGKLDNANLLPVNTGFKDFVDAMVVPRESGATTRQHLKYENVIPFRNAESLTTKFKLISGELPPGLKFLDNAMTGVGVNVDGLVEDSIATFSQDWRTENNGIDFDKETIFNSKIEFLDIQPTPTFTVGAGLVSGSQMRRIESIDTYTEDDVTKTKVRVAYASGTSEVPEILKYKQNRVYGSGGILTQDKDPLFSAGLQIGNGLYTYKDTKVITDSSNVQDQIYKDYDFVLGMYNGDTDSLLVQESFSIRVYQNLDAVRDDYLRTKNLGGIKKYFPFTDTISTFKLPLLKEDGTSVFIMLENGKLTFDDTTIASDNGLLSLLKENGSNSNITLQGA